MSTSEEILEQTRNFSPKERAAALGHWVYSTTAQETKDWNTRVPEEWSTLSPEAREFNLASVDTWVREEGVTQAWLEALQAYKEGRRSI